MEVGINLGENNDFLFSSAVINAHGQIVIPVKFRKQYNIQEGDTLILLGNPEQNGFGVMTYAGMSEVQKQLRAMSQVTEKIDSISNNFYEEDNIHMLTETALMLVILVILLITHIILALAAAKDIRQGSYMSGNNQILWLFVVIFIGIIGPLVYFVYGRKRR